MKLNRKLLKITTITIILFSFITAACTKSTQAWSNGGYSADPANPDYGTHDWIAQHALDFLPPEEKQFIVDNLQTYLHATEMPDNPQFIGDTSKHHIYFSANGTLQDDAVAARAEKEFQNALTFLKLMDYSNASLEAGIMSHYIADVSVFGHVMGAPTAWGAEKHHADYEEYVQDRTSTYNSSFSMYLHFDGNLSQTSAFKAAQNLAYDTTFDETNRLSCQWMDLNYNWSNPIFTSRAGESINLAVNAIADVLHTLYITANPPSNSQTPSPTPTQTASPTTDTSSTPTLTPSATPPAIPEMPSAIMAILLVASATTIVTIFFQKKRMN